MEFSERSIIAGCVLSVLAAAPFLPLGPSDPTIPPRNAALTCSVPCDDAKLHQDAVFRDGKYGFEAYAFQVGEVTVNVSPIEPTDRHHVWVGVPFGRIDQTRRVLPTLVKACGIREANCEIDAHRGNEAVTFGGRWVQSTYHWMSRP